MTTRLFVNQTSPYARKVRVVIKEKSLASRISLVEVDPWRDPPQLIDVLPLAKVPALQTDNGLVLAESDTICRYLDELGGSPFMMPVDIEFRSEVLARKGMLQGITDAAFDAVIEKRRPPSAQWADWIDRQIRAVERGLAKVSGWARPQGRFDLGDVSLACLLGYRDYRHPTIAWRMAYPAMAGWFDDVSLRTSMAETHPDQVIS